MKFTPKILSTILLLFFLPCAVEAQRNKVTPVYLDVAIDDLVSQIAGVRSDDPDGDPSSFDVYSHNVDSVSAQFSENGYFAFKSGTRSVRAVYSSPMDGGTLSGEDFRPSVEIMTFVGGDPLQNMTVGTFRCEGLAVNILLGDPAGTKRTIGYRAGRGTLTNTGFVKVTHPDGDTWVLESDTQGACPNDANEGNARIRDSWTKGKPIPDTDHGRYLMPLRIILTRR